MLLTFRSAEQKDAHILAELVYELNKFHNDDIRIDSKKFIEDWHFFEAYVVEDNDQILGFVAGYNTYRFHTATKRFEVQNLYVIENAREKGVAQFLFNELIALKAQQGIKVICLNVLPENMQAKRFYEKQGFVLKPKNFDRYQLVNQNF